MTYKGKPIEITHLRKKKNGANELRIVILSPVKRTKGLHAEPPKKLWVPESEVLRENSIIRKDAQ